MTLVISIKLLDILGFWSLELFIGERTLIVILYHLIIILFSVFVGITFLITNPL